MFEIVGFFVFILLNMCFSLFCFAWFLVGGSERNIILSSKEIGEIATCLICCAINIYLWMAIAEFSPF